MPKVLNKPIVINDRFERLVVIALAGKTKDGHKKYLCKCDCGNETVVIDRYLKNGNTKSCGCFKKDISAEANITHGLSKTRIYKTWASMKDRCLNPNCTSYDRYGGRGIAVCDDWLNFEPFFEWAVNNGYRDNLTIERKNVNGGYCPENCCWITKKAQSLNKSTTVKITKDGETHFANEWSEILGISKSTIYKRKQAGFSDAECLTIGRLPKRNLIKGGEM